MEVTTRALAAHHRMIETMPRERIRTHEHRPRDGDPIVRSGMFVPVTEDVRAIRRAAVGELVGTMNAETGKPWTYQNIGDRLGITKAAVARYACSIRAQRQKGGA